MRESEIPKDLAPTQYGTKLLENIGLPPIRSNILLMGECISAVSKSQSIRHDQAYVWLYARAKFALDAGDRVNYLWFSNGEYNGVNLARKSVASTFVPTDEVALAKEQATPEYQSVRQKLYDKFSVIAKGKIL